MKRLVAILLCMVVCGSFAACSSKKTETPKEEKQEKSFGLNETVALEKLRITALEFKQIPEEDFVGLEEAAKPQEGYVYVGIKFELENLSKEKLNISTVDLFNALVDGEFPMITMGADMAFSELSGNPLFEDPFSEEEADLEKQKEYENYVKFPEELKAGEKVVACYALEVPEDWEEIELTVNEKWLTGGAVKFVITNK